MKAQIWFESDEPMPVCLTLRQALKDYNPEGDCPITGFKDIPWYIWVAYRLLWKLHEWVSSYATE